MEEFWGSIPNHHQVIEISKHLHERSKQKSGITEMYHAFQAGISRVSSYNQEISSAFAKYLELYREGKKISERAKEYEAQENSFNSTALVLGLLISALEQQLNGFDPAINGAQRLEIMRESINSYGTNAPNSPAKKCIAKTFNSIFSNFCAERLYQHHEIGDVSFILSRKNSIKNPGIPTRLGSDQ